MGHGAAKPNSLKDKSGMKPSLAAVAAALIVGIAGCDSSNAPAKAPAGPTATPPAAEKAAATSAPPAAVPAAADTPVVAGTPSFAALYPGAVVEGDPTTAAGPAGPGGILTFTTDAAPEAVIDFYRQRAEASGLAPVMSMNQGDARAYGAARAANDASVQVVASPSGDGLTSVQLSWSAGL